MFGIIGAMEIEIDGLRQKMSDIQTETISGIRFDFGTINGVPCTLAVCGPGKVNAAVCAQTMIMRFKPSFIINSGVAGGIGKNMHVKDVVIATSVVQHDVDTSPLGDPVGLISGINIIEINAGEPISSILAEKAKEVYKGNVFRGIIATGDQFMADRAKIHDISERFNAIACEMEGGSIGQVCYMNNVPFAVLRTISDNGNDEAVDDYPKFAREAADCAVELLSAALPNLYSAL